MKDVLFIAPDHVGIVKVIREQLEGNKGYAVDFFDLELSPSDRFRYKSFNQRVRNFFSKIFKKKNLKQQFYHQRIGEKIRHLHKRYDVIAVIRPDLLTDKNLQLLRDRTGHFVAYYWDTISFYPRKGEIIQFFDRVFSFDTSDCKTYGFEFLTNFYYYTHDPGERKYDVYGIVNYDERAPQLEKIGALLDEKKVSYSIKAWAKSPFESDHITRMERTVEYGEMVKEVSYCNIMLEIQKEGQKGLSFRPFESLGLRKKLITNNPLIKQYDFYSDHNICVVDPENLSIPDEFFSTGYQDIDPAIREKYHFKHWFDRLVSPLPATFADNG